MSYILDSSSSLERRRRERARLDLLDEVSGAWVRRVLTQCGVAAGWHCLDVGAGAGHLARWMASEVGPEGRVVATDTDP
jgi:ubiquinone/menaquinone biosynthesis C-methylase UbiE